MRRLQVVDDLLQHALLRGRGMKRKNLLHLLANAIGGLESNAPSSCDLLPPEREDQLQQKELFEDEPAMVAATARWFSSSMLSSAAGK